MTCVLGYPLSMARSLLEAEGRVVRTQELSCRKPLPGGEERVVRRQVLPDGTVLLTYSRFHTGVAAAQDAQTDGEARPLAPCSPIVEKP